MREQQSPKTASQSWLVKDNFRQKSSLKDDWNVTNGGIPSLITTLSQTYPLILSNDGHNQTQTNRKYPEGDENNRNVAVCRMLSRVKTLTGSNSNIIGFEFLDKDINKKSGVTIANKDSETTWLTSNYNPRADNADADVMNYLKGFSYFGGTLNCPDITATQERDAIPLTLQLNEIAYEPQVVFVKKSGGVSNKTEITLLSGLDDFKSVISQTPTWFSQTGNNWQYRLVDWDNDGFQDLLGVFKSSTGSRKTEIHILSGAGGYQYPIFQVATILGETDASWTYDIGDWNSDGRPDLFAIKKYGGGSGRIEVHILDGSSGFQRFLLQTATAFSFAYADMDFLITDFNLDNRPDLIGIKKRQTGTLSTEVHILSGASGFSQFLLQRGTPLHETDASVSFAISDWDVQGIPDLVIFKRQFTGTNSTEIHILSGESGYTQYVLNTGTALPPSAMTDEFLIANDGVGDYNPQLRMTVSNNNGIYALRNSDLMIYNGQYPTGWSLLNQEAGLQIAATYTDLYKYNQNTLGLYQYSGNTVSPWTLIDVSWATTKIVATGSDLYKFQASNGWILRQSDLQWFPVDTNGATSDVVATRENLFQFQRNSGWIFRYLEETAQWEAIDTSIASQKIVSTEEELYQIHQSGSIYRFTGTPLSGWEEVSNITGVVDVYTDGISLYRKMSNRQIHLYQESPNQWVLVGWY